MDSQERDKLQKDLKKEGSPRVIYYKKQCADKVPLRE